MSAGVCESAACAPESPSPSDRQRLEAIVRDRTAPQKHVWRARIVLLTGDGLGANAVEGFFAKLTRRRLKRGVFHSVAHLQAAINRFVAQHNQTPAPFKWKADPDEIIAAAKRGRQTLEPFH